MPLITLSREMWNTIAAVSWITCFGGGVIILFLSILFDYVGLKAVDRYMAVSSISLLFGLLVGLYTNPASFRFVLEITRDHMPQRPGLLP